MLRRTPLSFLILVTFAFAQVHAQAPAHQPSLTNVDPALFKGLRYRLVGPSRGGRVTTVTGVPSQPKTFYMGVASGGLFRTTDAGTTWVPITDGKVPLRSEEHTSELQSRLHLVCRLLLEKKKKNTRTHALSHQ